MKNIILGLYHFLARRYISYHQPIIIWVTWSAGKSTAVQAIWSTLNTIFDKKIAYSSSNFNGERWLPMSIFGITQQWWRRTHCKNIAHIMVHFFGPSCDIYVLEYGIDYDGEMQKLLSIAKPHYSFITNIWTVHFGDPKKTRKAKSPLIHATKKATIIPQYYKNLISWIDVFDHTCISITNTKLTNMSYTCDISRWTRTQHVQTNSLDDHSLYGIWVGLMFGDMIAHQLWYILRLSPTILIDIPQPPSRFSLLHWIHNSIIVDSSYNNSPDSFYPTFEQFRSLRAHHFSDYPVIAVIWEMRELYESDVIEHTKLGEFLARQDIEYYFLVWKSIEVTAQILRKNGIDSTKIIVSKNSREVWLYLKKLLDHNTYCLFFKWSQNTIFLEEAIKLILSNSIDIWRLCRQSPSRLAKKEVYFKNIMDMDRHWSHDQ